MPVVPNNARHGESGEIVKPKILLVEGKDETIFFEAYLKNNQVLNGKIDDIQIIEMGGVENFKNELTALKNRTGFSENVKSIAIVRDADLDYDSAFQSVCDLLVRNGLSHPTDPGTFTHGENINVGVFIMPGGPENGSMLEDLCLRTQGANPIMSCIDVFFSCLEGKDIVMPRNLPKAKVQVFLASMPKIVSSLGLGALKGYWDLNHDCLSGLSSFLEEL